MIIEVLEIGQIIEVIESGIQIVEVLDKVGPRGPRGLRGESGAKSNIFPEAIILNEDHINQKFFYLQKEPETDFIYFHPSGGPPQRLGIDFELIREEKKVSWENTDLHKFLEPNDRVELFYVVS
jgi:hypothetical protein